MDLLKNRAINITSFEKIVKKKINKMNCLYYNKSGNFLDLLLLKKNKTLSQITNDITNFDNFSTFCFARTMCNKLFGIFGQKYVSQINSQMSINDNLIKQPLNYNNLIKNEVYLESLLKITSNDVKICEINNEIVYLLENPFQNIKFLNSEIKKQNFDFEFDTLRIDIKSKLTVTNPQNEQSIGLKNLLNNINFEDTFKNNKDLYIILSCDPDTRNFNSDYGTDLVSALFQGMLREKNESWELYCPFESFPSEEKLRKTKGLIIPGSYLSAYQDLSYLRKTEEFLRNILSLNYQDLRILGICFGHQLIAQALGGKVNKGNKYIFKEEKIAIKKDFWELDFVRGSGIEKNEFLNIHQNHGDEVVDIPENCNVYGFSESCRNEILYYPNHKILTFQGHPESEHVSESLKKSVFTNKYDYMYRKLENHINTYSSDEWRKIMKSFLKS